MLFKSLALTALMGLSQAVDVQVVYVGQNPVNNATAPKYWPEKITAAPGTMVQFQFWAGNHTITQSSFNAPCVPLAPNTTAGANASAPIKSGFQPVSASAGEGGAMPIYTIMINDTKPVWLYCGQGQHCANGMSLVINENTASGNTLEVYRQTASTLAPGGGSNGGETPTNGGGETPSGGNGQNGGDNTGNTGGENGGDIPSDGGQNGQPPSAASSLAVSSGAAILAAGLAMALL
jgi:plastocyanin